jgi:hypothetical protein
MMAWVLLCLAALCGASVFDAELRSFVETHGVASAHCGVAFDVVTGHATSVPVFAQPRFQIDPFVGGVDQRVEEVRFFVDVFFVALTRTGDHAGPSVRGHGERASPRVRAGHVHKERAALLCP